MARRIRQGDVGKEPDTVGVTRARRLLLVVRAGTLSGCLTHCLHLGGSIGIWRGKMPASCKWFHLSEPQVPHVILCTMDFSFTCIQSYRAEVDEETDVNIIYKLLSAGTLERLE